MTKKPSRQAKGAGGTASAPARAYEKPCILCEGDLETLAAACTSNSNGLGRCRTPGTPFTCYHVRN
jgi:hypothetical protein